MLESKASGARRLLAGSGTHWTVFWIARWQQLDPNALDGRMTKYGLCMLLSYHVDGKITLSVYCLAEVRNATLPMFQKRSHYLRAFGSP
jgi:hypothetical protein